MPAASGADLEQKMKDVSVVAVQPEVHLRPDRQARYEVVASKRSWLTRIGVIGSVQFME